MLASLSSLRSPRLGVHINEVPDESADDQDPQRRARDIRRGVRRDAAGAGAGDGAREVAQPRGATRAAEPGDGAGVLWQLARQQAAGNLRLPAMRAPAV